MKCKFNLASAKMTHVITPEKIKPSERSHVPAKSIQQKKTLVKLTSPVKGSHVKQNEVTTPFRKEALKAIAKSVL